MPRAETGAALLGQEEARLPPGARGSASLHHFRKQKELWRLWVRDVTPAQAAAGASAVAAAAVASEPPGSLQVEEEDPEPLLPQV